MNETAPWYTSAIVRQSLVQILTPLLAYLGIKAGIIDVEQLVAYILGAIAMLTGAVTLLTRIFKPAPNLSATAVNKEIELVAAGKIPPSPTGPTT